MPMLAEDFATSQIEFLNQQKLPVVIRPMAGESLPEYFSAAGGSIVETLRQHGAILFRGFSLRTADEFQAACACLFKNELHSYIGGISPRRELLPGVFESTQLPAHLHMPQHNEMSYLPAPPRTIVFFCEVEPTEGGETPLAGSRAILEAIPVALRKKFERYGVRYHRQMYGPRRNALYAALNRWLKVRRSWMETFSTTDRAEVERICAMQGGTPHWDHEEGLSVTTNLPATRRHPETGEPLWFNHVASFLVSPRSMGRWRYWLYRLAYTDPLKRPAHATFGNGDPITADQLKTIHRAIDGATIRFRWQQGDFLLLDNFTVTHGRMPFRGNRRILVAMS